MRHADIFNAIYTHNVWGKGSGEGSAEELTREYRKFLHNFLRANRIRSVVDLGCGDWQFSRHMDWSGIEYCGVDVSSVVLEATRSFSAPNIRFQEMNGIEGALPPADLLICKDVVQHWSNADIARLFPRLNGFRFALITNAFHPAITENQDIATGEFRPLNLLAKPFDIKGSYIYCFMAGEPKGVFLWSREG
jgi:SAM-dependent methyltransferase